MLNKTRRTLTLIKGKSIDIDPNYYKSSYEPELDFDCLYCKNILTDSKEKDVWNRPIIESQNFVVIPTLGAFLIGWLLIISKMHYLCIGSLPDSLFPELINLKRKVKYILNQTIGPTISFEHGPCSSYERAGSCIDHAHLHIVPTKIDLLKDLRKNFKIKKSDTIRESKKFFLQKRPYILYENVNDNLFYFEVETLPSQYMRRLLAKKLNLYSKYDWRKHSEVKNIIATKDIISAYLKNKSSRGKNECTK